MNFLNILPLSFWLFVLIPLTIFLLNRREKKIVKFSSIRFLLNLKNNEINRLKLINIILLILRTLIILLILIIVMRPYINDLILPENFSDEKVHNFILVDDSFYNKYGYYESVPRLSYIDKVIEEINNQYSDKSRITISTSNKGIIYDAYNNNKFIYSDTESQILNYVNSDIFFKQDLNNVNNLHLISNLNKKYIDLVSDSLNTYKKNFYNIYYYHLPALDSNLYISNVKLITKKDQMYVFTYEIGNIGMPDKDLNISIYKNDYSFDSNLIIEQKIPIFNKEINIKKGEILLDTIQLNYDRDYLSELFFNLENIDKSNIFDNLNEDNHYSFINNKLNDVKICVLFNNQNEKKYIETVLNTFKSITSDIDTNFLKIKYIKENEFNKFSKSIMEAEIFICLGYGLFSNLKNQLYDIFEDKKIHLLVFPSIVDNQFKNDKLILSDSLLVNIGRYSKIKDNYDTLFYHDEKYDFLETVKIDKLKLNDYFAHEFTKFSKFSTKINNSIWSSFKEKKISIDLFGFMIDNGNNFFSDESFIAVPLLYDILLNNKYDFNKNNITINTDVTISNQIQKFKFMDMYSEPIIFMSKTIPKIDDINTKLLFENDSVVDLFSFNPPNTNIQDFYNIEHVENKITNRIMNFYDFFNNSKNLLMSISINEITKYLIYSLCLLVYLSYTLK